MPKLALIVPASSRRPGRTLKNIAGDTGMSLQEWLMNIVSATKVDGAPAIGAATLRPIGDEMCLMLDSHTGVMSTGHCCDVVAVSEMFAMGPSDGSKGLHNEKGIGLRLLQCRLGGKESVAAELLVITRSE